MFKWFSGWLSDAYRTLKPDGTLKAFCGTRTLHLLIRAMKESGFSEVRLECWYYTWGMPKGLNIYKNHPDVGEEWEGWNTTLAPRWEPVLIGIKK